MAKRIFDPDAQFYDGSGAALNGGQLFFYTVGTTTKTTTYPTAADADAATNANTNPVVLNANGRLPVAGVFVPDANDAKVVVAPSTDTDPPISPILTVDGLGWGGTAADLTYIQGGTSPTRRAVETRLREMPSALDFSGVDATGATNSTTGLLNFFNYCIDNQLDGWIPDGTYLITEGGIVLDNGHTDKTFPNIYTAGHNAVIFKGAGSANSPILTISNGTASSGVGKFWHGGYLGGITFKDTTSDTATSRHGLQLRGIFGMRFGHMKGDALRADVVHIEQQLFGGTNPDPYNVSACTFEAINGESCIGRSLNNDNYQGFTGCEIRLLRGILNEGGLFRGYGAHNTVILAAAGSVKGWAFEEGTAAGFAAFGFNLLNAELDDVEKGIEANVLDNAYFKARFIHRYNGSALNSGNIYWPTVAVDVGGLASPSMNNVKCDLIHRIESGGVKANVGEFLDMNSAAGNIAGLEITQEIDDEASFGFDDTDLYTGFNAGSRVSLQRNGTIILKSIRNEPLLLARVNAAQNVTNSTAAVIVFDVEEYDQYGSYNNSTGEYTTPYAGVFIVRGQISVTGMADGETCTLTIENAGTTVASHKWFAHDSSLQTFPFYRTINVSAAGNALRVKGTVSSGAAKPITTGSQSSFLEIVEG